MFFAHQVFLYTNFYHPDSMAPVGSEIYLYNWTSLLISMEPISSSFLCNSIGNRNHIGVMQVKGIKLCNNSPFVNFGAAIV